MKGRLGASKRLHDSTKNRVVVQPINRKKEGWVFKGRTRSQIRLDLAEKAEG